MVDAALSAGGAIYRFLVPLACGPKDQFMPLLGLSQWQFSLAKAGVFVAFFVPVLVTWYQSKHRLYANGFAKPMWQWGLALVTLATIVPVLEAFAVPIMGPVYVCPYDWFTLFVISFIVVAGLYCFQLGRRYNDSKVKRGGFRRFIGIIAGPLLGDIVFNSPKIGTASANLLVRLVEATGKMIGHI